MVRMIEFKSSQKVANTLHDGRLRFPSAVCIDENDILYVTEVDNHCISVFKINDNTEASTNFHIPPKFLTAFGKKSDCEPFYYGGIAVDKKGMVYVTDSCNDELKMFLI